MLVFIGFTTTEVETFLAVESGVEFFFYAVVARTFGCGLWSCHLSSSFLYVFIIVYGENFLILLFKDFWMRGVGFCFGFNRPSVYFCATHLGWEVRSRGGTYALRFPIFFAIWYPMIATPRNGEATIATAVKKTSIWFRVPMMSIWFPFLFSIILV